MHADYGSGSFMGVDGAEYTPGDVWGHVNIDATSLTAGDHEFDVLGFEPCCDGHAEMEIHLPCDGPDDAWRIITTGQTECLECNGATIDAACSMDTASAGCCGNSGGHVLCRPQLEDGTCGENGMGASNEDSTSIVGRFIAVGEAMSQPDAVAHCNTHYAGIASIHTRSEQNHARTACSQYADDSITGCWIGFNDMETQGGFVWQDGSAVDYVDWAPGEPNGGGAAGALNGMEDHVMLRMVAGVANGEWNDADGSPDGMASCAANDECWKGAAAGLFPLCQVSAAPPPALGASTVWGTGQSASFRLQVCVDHIDTVYFQVNRDAFSICCCPSR